MLSGGARVSLLPESGTAVSHTLVRAPTLRGSVELTSDQPPCASPLEEVWAGLKSDGRVRAGNSRRPRLFHDYACVVAFLAASVVWVS